MMWHYGSVKRLTQQGVFQCLSGKIKTANVIFLISQYIMKTCITPALRQPVQEASHQAKTFLFRSPCKQLMKQKLSRDSLAEHI